MNALVLASWVSQVLQHLPGPVRRLLDAWSYQLALGKQRQRRQAWLSRQQPPAAVLPVKYKLKHWRD